MTAALSRRYYPSPIALLAQAMLGRYAPLSPAPAPRLFLSLPEAARYTGLSILFLKKLIERDQLRAIPDRPVKIARHDLERLAIGRASLSATAEEIRKVVADRRARR